jgi:large repetitive protein
VACGRLTSGSELFRVVVRVTWTPGAGRNCSGGPCAYVVSTLIDPTVDPIFNANRRPVANADTATVASGASVDIGVTANDSGEFAIAGSVTLLSSPANGSTSLSNNIVTYTPTSGFSGTNTFTYTVTDTASRTSNVAVVTVTVTPVGVADTSSTTPGTAAFNVAVLGNDRGSGLSLLSVTTPSIGTATVSGNNVRYTAPATTGGVATMTYTARDSSGQQYTSTLTVTVTVPATPLAYSFLLCKPGVGYTTNLMTAVTGTNLVPAGLTMTTTTAGLDGWTVSGPSATGVVTITKTNGNTGTLTFTITDPYGQTSNAATVTLKGSGSC